MNMSYCRFQNTLSDLRQCYEAMDDASSAEEAAARHSLIRLCVTIANDCADDDGEPNYGKYEYEITKSAP